MMVGQPPAKSFAAQSTFFRGQNLKDQLQQRLAASVFQRLFQRVTTQVGDAPILPESLQYEGLGYTSLGRFAFS